MPPGPYREFAVKQAAARFLEPYRSGRQSLPKRLASGTAPRIEERLAECPQLSGPESLGVSGGRSP